MGFQKSIANVAQLRYALAFVDQALKYWPAFDPLMADVRDGWLGRGRRHRVHLTTRSKSTVERLMRAGGWQGVRRQKKIRTTVSDPASARAPDLVDRQFTVSAPNRLLVADFTYVKTWVGWAYLATVIDLHSRAVIGWAVAEHMRTELVTAALDMAITHRQPPAGVIFHSDSEYVGAGAFGRPDPVRCRGARTCHSIGDLGFRWVL